MTQDSDIKDLKTYTVRVYFSGDKGYILAAYNEADAINRAKTRFWSETDVIPYVENLDGKIIAEGVEI